ncbi:hypothetical protein SERLA73DRAFT_177082 [Serpula lacrymans var. lacrymans S7.3]|uniref:Uncharacterized protein n=1 Tax=Serpula lacrymans var. lacrymans (strain S7.3) TaxID=936435 RepID=F8PR05_SERL3|nr:hypothetical protein SERLA73DRAFT_177082 [Serpula lacrymans var. lacrymans S7.3]
MSRSQRSSGPGDRTRRGTSTAPPSYTTEDHFQRYYQSDQTGGYYGPSESTASDGSASPYYISNQSRPPYTPNEHAYNEHSPLNPGAYPTRPKETAQKGNSSSGFFVFLVIILLCFGWSYAKMISGSKTVLDPGKMEELRHEWSLELVKHEEEHKVWEAERITWEHDRMEHEDDLRREREKLDQQRNQERKVWEALRKAWERERLEHEEELRKERQEKERQRQERERELEERHRREEQQRREEEERIRLGLYWDEVQSEGHCYAYGTREYTARLMNLPATYDRMKGCWDTPITIHDVKLDHPYRCENRGYFNGMYGHFLVKSGETACQPYWGTFDDKGCANEGSHTRLIQSRLWNIPKGDDWNQMCSTTPADFHGLHFEGPRYCEDKGIWGVYGVWEVEDLQC